MKKIKYTLPLLLLLTINITTVKSQTKTDSIIQLQFPNEAVIAADNMNVLYIGMENPISVSVPGEKLEDITISCSDGADVRMVKFGHYIAVAYPKAKDVYITTMVKGMYKGYTHFRVKSVPKYYALLGNLATGAASLKDVLKQDTVFAGFGDDLPFEGMNYIITKFNFVYTPSSKLHTPADSAASGYFTVTGQMVTPQIKEYIKNAKTGDLIQLNGFEAVGSNKAKTIKIPAALSIKIE